MIASTKMVRPFFIVCNIKTCTAVLATWSEKFTAQAEQVNDSQVGLVAKR